ncbi:MAG: hypothetical protein JNM56_33200 [Planctomycetia bacterium]|nr:hypothetical protein [Planctomycetia bacterium]
MSRLDSEDDYSYSSPTGPRIPRIIVAIGKLNPAKVQDELLRFIAEETKAVVREKLKEIDGILAKRQEKGR